jgi:lysophospholipase L1-like esterase
MMAEMKRGDTVLIQFGHNDATKAKPSALPTRRCSATTAALDLDGAGRGANPVLVTPVAPLV